jgi:hypothetical protein|tara:strand:+ start:478 stop:747 length:270 start_codon:yes stop_codon:yes gene_type:complete
VAKKQQFINPLIQSLNILAGKLTEKEYKTVSGNMFRLYMGDKLGYRDQFDPQFMADITAVWQFRKKKKLEKKVKLYKFKILKGGKDEQK